MIVPPAPSKRDYFVDEAGDAVLFNRTGRIGIGQEGCSRYFILGMTDIPQVEILAEALDRLRARLLADPYFKAVPSMQPAAGKTATAFHIYFARRGAADRAQALYQALDTARQRFAAQWQNASKATISVIPATPSEQAGLQATDYLLWALQRLYERREDRFVTLMRPAFSLVHDLDDTRLKQYGAYYTQKKPLTIAALGDPPGI